jgi:hypothetical protein
MLVFSRSNKAARLIALSGLALLLVGCPPGSPAGGNVHLRISLPFDDRAQEESLWHAGTISAEGEFPASKLDTMDFGSEYAWDLLGPTPWMATTQQQMGDFTGDCNGGECNPCTGEFGGSWEIEAVQLNMQERGNGRYVFQLWLGSGRPPKTGGCDAMINSPAYWANRLIVTLTGMDTATPAGTAVDDGFPVGAYTVEVSKT